MYSIIASGGKQYKVNEGDVIRVEKLNVEEGEQVTFDEVLFLGDGEESVIGKPYVDNAKVSATVISNGKASKVTVYKYKRKSGYHKKNGHRQSFTELRIDSIAH